MATEKQVQAAATAIANEIWSHSGSPPVANILDILKPHNRERMIVQARMALEAAERVDAVVQ